LANGVNGVVMELIWITDPHLNFLGQPFGPKAFGVSVFEEHPNLDAVVMTGDLAECDSFKEMVESFAQGVGKTVWFVLGNHDAYNGSIRWMKKQAASMKGLARWLVTEKLVELAPGVALVGQDGWYDARNGKPQTSNVALSDFFAIGEFLGKWGNGIIAEASSLADNEAQVADRSLREAIEKGYKRIVFATHVPPYALATWHEGKISDGNFLPWMSSKVMGEVLDEIVSEHLDVDITVLCGHTHSPGTYRRAPNLTVLTGRSRYGYPCVSGEFNF
jgi:3',5'-cyclic AMP phosphodiesterase CpdA